MSETSPTTWSQTTDVTGPTPAETFLLGIRCSDMPTDGQVGFTIAQPAPLPPVDQPMTPITNPNLVMLVPCDWPAGGEGSITVDYQQGATPPPAGASITVVMLIPQQGPRFEPMTF